MKNDVGDAPLWILRHHSPSPIHAIRLFRFQKDDRVEKRLTFILAGDSQGRISLTNLRDLRPRYFWKAHSKNILGLDLIKFDDEKGFVILSQGRDNKLLAHQIQISQSNSLAVLPSRIQDDLPIPKQVWSLDVNSLNYCSMSVISSQNRTLVALPHTLDSGYIDIIQLSPEFRFARAIGQADIQSSTSRSQRAPMCMSMDLIEVESDSNKFEIIAGYEDGFIRSWLIEQDGSSHLQWQERKHSESIMASTCSSDGKFAASVGADDVIGYYDLVKGKQGESKEVKCKSMGNASIAIRKDGNLIAVGGWDGSVRLYDSNLQHTASLRYHKDTVQTLSFAELRTLPTSVKDIDEHAEYEEEEDEDEIESKGSLNSTIHMDNILITGGKEGRICIWKT